MDCNFTHSRALGRVTGDGWPGSSEPGFSSFLLVIDETRPSRVGHPSAKDLMQHSSNGIFRHRLVDVFTSLQLKQLYTLLQLKRLGVVVLSLERHQ